MSEGDDVVPASEPGPIITDFGRAKIVYHIAFSINHAVWVPAFAGTTN
jgi:hypothetical protein